MQKRSDFPPLRCGLSLSFLAPHLAATCLPPPSSLPQCQHFWSFISCSRSGGPCSARTHLSFRRADTSTNLALGGTLRSSMSKREPTWPRQPGWREPRGGYCPGPCGRDCTSAGLEGESQTQSAGASGHLSMREAVKPRLLVSVVDVLAPWGLADPEGLPAQRQLRPRDSKRRACACTFPVQTSRCGA